MSAPLRLRHLHIAGHIPYTTSLAVQSHILNQHFAYRNHLRASPPPLPTSTPYKSVFIPGTPTHPPSPTIVLPALLTFTTHPTYTVGRRHLESSPLSQSEIDYLIARDPDTDEAAAEFHASSRGGLLTYHGPGQLTAFALIDLRAHGLGARQYVRMLEDAVINTCKSLGVPNVGVSCTDPGVWMLDEPGEVTDRKICALGVQITRGVSSYGIGLNVKDLPFKKGDVKRYKDLKSAATDPEKRGVAATATATVGNDQPADTSTQPYIGQLGWAFRRIVACGLEGKQTTWLSNEYPQYSRDEEAFKDKTTDWPMHEVASTLAHELSNSLTTQGKVEMAADVQTVQQDAVDADPELKNMRLPVFDEKNRVLKLSRNQISPTKQSTKPRRSLTDFPRIKKFQTMPPYDWKKQHNPLEYLPVKATDAPSPQSTTAGPQGGDGINSTQASSSSPPLTIRKHFHVERTRDVRDEDPTPLIRVRRIRS